MTTIWNCAIFDAIAKEGNDSLININEKIEDDLNYKINSSNMTMILIFLTKSSLNCINKVGKTFYKQDLKHWSNNVMNQILVIMQR